MQSDYKDTDAPSTLVTLALKHSRTADNLSMLLQATVRAPAARNMIRKTLPFNYLVGSVPFLFLSFVGYWAYGNEVGYNILYSSSGPKWAIALAYVCAAVQIIVSFHVSHWTWSAYLCMDVVLVHEAATVQIS